MIACTAVKTASNAQNVHPRIEFPTRIKRPVNVLTTCTKPKKRHANTVMLIETVFTVLHKTPVIVWNVTKQRTENKIHPMALVSAKINTTTTKGHAHYVLVRSLVVISVQTRRTARLVKTKATLIQLQWRENALVSKSGFWMMSNAKCVPWRLMVASLVLVFRLAPFVIKWPNLSRNPLMESAPVRLTIIWRIMPVYFAIQKSKAARHAHPTAINA